eukprot:gene21082-27318_t
MSALSWSPIPVQGSGIRRRGELTLAQLAVMHSVDQRMINAWKREAIDGMSEAFSGKDEAIEEGRQGEIEKLHAMICQLVVERDFLKRAFAPGFVDTSDLRFLLPLGHLEKPPQTN